MFDQYWANVVEIEDLSNKLWVNIGQTLGRCVVFAGIGYIIAT